MSEFKNTIAVSHHYFQQHTNSEYQNWKHALVREFVQNGRDCGSKRIDFRFEGDFLTVENDGRPMSLDIMTNVLLSLGGSFKDDPDAVGGFGQAKNLLYFRWSSWSVMSGGYLIRGSGPNYADPEEVPFFAGTRSVLNLKKDGVNPGRLEDDCEWYMKLCQLGDCHLYLNGERIEGTLHRGRKIGQLEDDDGPFADTFFNKSADRNSRVLVFVNGLFMFHSAFHDAPGQVSVNLTRPSKDLMTANRDGLRGTYSAILESFVYKLAKDSESTTREKNDIVTLIPGNGAVRSRKDVDTLRTAMATLVTLKEKAQDDVSAALQIEAAITALSVTQDLHFSSTSVKDVEKIIQELDDEIQRLVECDYVWVKERGCDIYDSRIKQYLETDGAKKLMRIWKDMLVLACQCAEIDITFTPGFLFSNDDAMRRKEVIDGSLRTVYLINPFNLPRKKDVKPYEYLDILLQNVVHELCHHWHEYHDTSFVDRYHKVWTKCIQKIDEFKQIMKNA